ncbi:MAG: hypothetical protein V1787_00905 [Candidatus Micrarchaeota archaeon]
MAGESVELKEAFDEFKEFREQMKNPLVIGAMLHRLGEEKASANLVLKEINAKLDRLLALESRIAALEGSMQAASARPQDLLPEIDSEMLAFVRKRGKACAEEVQQHFHYRGTNAASSRLNRMAREGMLAKAQVGRKVYFIAEKTNRKTIGFDPHK